jgi:predicted enzyme related to lactoylglutathione lyase
MAIINRIRIFIVASVLVTALPLMAQSAAPESHSAPSVAVAPQYDTSHVYVPPQDVDAFVKQFLGTFGGKSTKQVIATVTPTPSSTSSQLLQTPVGTVSLFGFKTPIPAPFGSERTGLLVSDLDAAVASARSAGAEVVVTIFPDPIGRDVVVRFPGGLMTQLYWHTTAPSYAAFTAVPENRVYISPDSAEAFLHSFLHFTHGGVVADEAVATGAEIGRPGYTFRRIRLESQFGKTLVFVTDGILPYPYGRETTGYEVEDLPGTLSKATSLGVKVLVPPVQVAGRKSAMVEFAGGYIAEIHSKPDGPSKP